MVRRIGPRTLVAALLPAFIVLFSSIIRGIIKTSDGTVFNTNMYPSRKISTPTFSIAIIGSAGYIGSRLLSFLQATGSYSVTGYDRHNKGGVGYDITPNDLRSFHTIIYLGRITDRKKSGQKQSDLYKENVKDIYNLTKRMSSTQLLIFTSTAEILEGSGSIPANESFSIQHHLLDNYVTSFLEREKILREMTLDLKSSPRIVGLRLGTVIGLSNSQRTDLLHLTYICEAFTSGSIHVNNPAAHRSILVMEDLLDAMQAVIIHHETFQRFELFHLQSFSVSITNIASNIASRLGARLRVLKQSSKKISRGFSLDTKKFRNRFNFSFYGNHDHIITQLINDVPRICVSNQSYLDRTSVPCVVCGSQDMHLVLDLHEQPLANDFRKQSEDATRSKRFPLRLVRCPICYHTQLSHIVDRAYLFSHYLYQSGTSRSIEAYFEWLAEKVIDESRKTSGTVLEIASNDGSQLSSFSKRGWTTVGVDPARNLAELARAKGHTVFVGFWGTDSFPDLPSPQSLDVIVAQNVIAHVVDPVQFLLACASVMGTTTRLYIQTSQCEMYETGQFDTVYHEHISFFTAHSFDKIASLTGLQIIHFEITPIHGRSCLVTFRKRNLDHTVFETSFHKRLPPSFELALQKERNLGLTDPWFYTKYQARAYSMRQWIASYLTELHAHGHIIAGYGAAAKGTVLLHSLLEIPNQTWSFSFIVDDAPLKQNTYCPGTSIPVRPSSALIEYDFNKPLTMVVFAWNFWEEISSRIRASILGKGNKDVFVILPFPNQQLIKVDSKSNTIVSTNIFEALPWPFPLSPSRKPVILFSYLTEKNMFLSSWIRHHASIFDLAVLVNCDSTNFSSEIITNDAPSTWKIITANNRESCLTLTNRKLNSYARLHPKAWKIFLTTSEYLMHSNLREMLEGIDKRTGDQSQCFRSLMMVVNDSTVLTPSMPLISEHTHYISMIDTKNIQNLSVLAYRCIHHNLLLNTSDEINADHENSRLWPLDGFIADYQNTFPFKVGINIDPIQQKYHISKLKPAILFNNNGVVKSNNLDGSLNSIRLDNLKNFAASNEEMQMAHRVWKELMHL